MEDPWGSPWTSDEPPKIDLPAPPPHAHFTADHSGSSQRVSPAHTPWNEDDDAWGGWAEAGKDSSPRWGRSPGLRPIRSSPAGSRLPSPTPDPWGQLPTFNAARLRKEDNDDSANSLGEGLRPILGRIATRAPSPARSLKENAADIWQQPDRALSNRSISPLPSEDEARPGSPDGTPRPALQRGIIPAPLRQPSNKVSELVEMYDDIAKRSHSVSPIDPSMRKASGNTSVQDVVSEPKVNGQEKLGEELQAKNEPELWPESEEKPELHKEVEVVVEVREESKLEPKPGTKVEIVSEGTPKQGEELMGKEPEQLIKDEEREQIESNSWSDFESPSKEVPQDGIQESEVRLPEEQPQTLEAAAQEEVAKEATPAPVRPRAPSVPFSIDMTKLGDIFPSVNTSFPSPEPIPDVIIDDSFTSISERKAWYLMSRPGSMRKHNLGDDENYVRIGWGDSQVRDQSIRIVRRWMEEDSITGRVVLGRRNGAAGAKIFNWDSSAPSTEVSISELLARKNHSRQTSMASKGTVASPTAAVFGWSTSPVPSPTVAAPPSAHRTSDVSEPRASAETSPVEATKTSISKTTVPPLESPPRPRIVEEPPSPIKPTPLKPTNRPISITQPLPFPASPTFSEPQSPVHPPSLLSANRPISISQAPTSPLAQPPTNAGWGEEEDDDEDWGDMVSSPTIETNGGFTSMDAVVDSETANSKGDTSKPLITAQSPLDESFKSTPTAKTVINGRPSMDKLPLPPQSSAPNHSQLPMNAWNVPSLQGAMSTHSRSTTVDLGTPRSPLDGFASANLMSNKAESPIDQASRVNTWGSWGLGLLDDSNKPVRPNSVFATQNLELHNQVDTLQDMASPKKPRPMSLPVPPRPQRAVESPNNDEIVVNILRDLPDLSYMLR
ncbi:hypothetical protein F53441_6056 [Fusarium austroafricanum]|uniref:Uncharacterized protein n=1 Tax=Fusarium austroafricanum TaxID=2364996 RepID=A0A8H4KKF3_9HYPO|nr:hypothetical protein F53441_6056 [Fusarium austroafricanum]